MTARNPLTPLAVVGFIIILVGCNRPTGTFTPVTPPSTPAAATGDYRTMAKPQLQDFIKSKIGVDEVTLTEKGQHTYSGTLKHLDGTILPLEVTVEADRIVCDTKTPAGSTRQIITPHGVNSDLNIK
jgi:hypothetical protein